MQFWKRYPIICIVVAILLLWFIGTTMQEYSDGQPDPMSWIWIIGIVALCLYGIHKYDVNKRNQKQQIMNYIHKLAPSNSMAYLQVFISQNDSQLLSLNKTSPFMYVDTNHIITFPESSHNYKYYLTAIDFHPKYYVRTNGTNRNNGYSYTGMFGDSIHIHGNYSGLSKPEEVPTTALVSFVNKNNHHTINISFRNMNTSSVRFLKKYFELGQLEKQQILHLIK